MKLYLILSTAILLFSGVVWSKKTWLNTFIGGTLLAVGGYGLIVTLQYFGYIIRTNTVR